MPSPTRAALVKARQRRLALDKDRQARDVRVEQATARVFLGLTQRGAAQDAVQTADLEIGRALRDLLAERLSVEDAAQLCDLNGAEVRRLLRSPGQRPPHRTRTASVERTSSDRPLLGLQPGPT